MQVASRGPCSLALNDVVAGTPVTYELRDDRWVAIVGRHGITEITRDTLAAVKADVESLYRHGRQSAA